MRIYLLDVNVLLALFDESHTHHRPAHRWFNAHEADGWATCPITESGYLRVSSSPGYPSRRGGLDSLAILRENCANSAYYFFWHDDATLRDLLPPRTVFTHSQVTDLYLLGLALHHQGMLATFDNNVPASLIAGGRRALELIPV